MAKCPQCNIQQVIKNGHTQNGKQRFKCRECGRQFVENPTKIMITEETKALIDRLLFERISWAGIARAAQVSEKWLQDYVNQKYAQIPRQVKVSAKKRRVKDTSRWVWSFVDNKGSKQKEGQIDDNSNSPQIKELILSGIIISQNSYLKPHNHIYQTIFDLNWTMKIMEHR